MHHAQPLGGLPDQVRPRPRDHEGGGVCDPPPRRGKRSHPRNLQHRRCGRGRRHLQLLRMFLPVAARGAPVPVHGYDQVELPRAGRCAKVRGLRPVRGKLPDERAEARPEALLHRADPRQGDADALRARLGQGQVERQLARKPRGCGRNRHRAVQDEMSRAHRRAGLHQARRAGQVHRCARAHQEGKPVPGHLRPRLPALLRGRLHPRRRGRSHRHRRDQEVHRRKGPARRDPLCAEDGQHHRQAVPAEGRRHRRRSGRSELRVLSRAEGLSRHRV